MFCMRGDATRGTHRTSGTQKAASNLRIFCIVSLANRQRKRISYHLVTDRFSFDQITRNPISIQGLAADCPRLYVRGFQQFTSLSLATYAARGLTSSLSDHQSLKPLRASSRMLNGTRCCVMRPADRTECRSWLMKSESLYVVRASS